VAVVGLTAMNNQGSYAPNQLRLLKQDATTRPRNAHRSHS